MPYDRILSHGAERHPENVALGAVGQDSIVRHARIVEGRTEERHQSAFARSRSVYFCTLPVDVVGNGPNWTVRGTAKCGRLSRQNVISSSAVAAVPSRSWTNAHGVSPHFSSGRATTADISTAGWRFSAISTSIEEMFSPPEMMMSFARSLISM